MYYTQECHILYTTHVPLIDFIIFNQTKVNVEVIVRLHHLTVDKDWVGVCLRFCSLGQPEREKKKQRVKSKTNERRVLLFRANTWMHG